MPVNQSTFENLFLFIIRSIIEIYIYYDYYWSFPGGSDGKESSCNMGDLSLVPGLGRSPGEGNSSPLQYSGLESPHEQKSRWATVHWVTKSWTWLSDFHFMIIIIFWISSMRNCEKLFSVLLYTYIILLLSLGLQSWPFTEKKKLFWSCSTEVDHYCMRCLEIIGTN